MAKNFLERRQDRPRLFTSSSSAITTAQLSVVVPVCDEEANVLRLHARLAMALDRLQRRWEVVYVDDGSRDGSLKLLRGLAAADPRVVTVELTGNHGQHAALLAGMERCQGDVVVTMDADLSDPPEEIGALLEALERGHDVATGRRQLKTGPLWKRMAGYTVDRVASGIMRRDLTDWSSMMRAYRREVVARMLKARPLAGHLPALGAACARRLAEVPVRREPRSHGQSRAGAWRVARQVRDLVTGFTVAPLEWILVLGVAALTAGGLATAWLVAGWFFFGHQAGLGMSLFAFGTSCTGVLLVALGVVAEYIGRLHRHLMAAPRAVVARIHHAGSCEIVEA